MQADEDREYEQEELDWEAREALDDPEGPQECDLLAQGDPDEPDTVECPNCGEDILEDADQCPHCHQWVIQGGQTDAQSHGFVFILIAALILVVLAYWLQ
ncbi:MAG: zinc ribbon domain-containing protein [Phycisphaerae bacterium]|nr:zinc ribbon domain-containing protein [Phycisphaerae bacterium]